MTGFGDIGLKFPLILAISVFIGSLNFMFSRVEDEKCFIAGQIKRLRFLVQRSLRLAKASAPSDQGSFQ